MITYIIKKFFKKLPIFSCFTFMTLSFCHTMDIPENASLDGCDFFEFHLKEDANTLYLTEDDFVQEILNSSSCQIHWYQQVLKKLNDPIQSKKYIESISFGADIFSRNSQETADTTYYEMLDQSAASVAKDQICRLSYYLVYWQKIERAAKEKNWDELANIALNMMNNGKLIINTFKNYIYLYNKEINTTNDNISFNDILLIELNKENRNEKDLLELLRKLQF